MTRRTSSSSGTLWGLVWAMATMVLGSPVPSIPANSSCSLATLKPLLEANLAATTVTNVTHLTAGSTILTSAEVAAAECYTSAPVSADMCRVEMVVMTSNNSQLLMEAWLPDVFYGRFLGIGNGGLNGCITYIDMALGSAQHFAVVGTNNGHNGDTGVFFLNHPEIIKDFAYRSIVTEATLGKQIVELYYGSGSLGKSYYTGCSTGGRQGFRMLQDFPELFDGILAGSPALDWNHLIGSGGVFASILGTANNHSGLLTDADFNLITEDVLAQCDGIDGLIDGIIDDPDECNYRAEKLLCPAVPAVNSTANATFSTCLSSEKVAVVNMLFTPLFGTQGELLMPRLDPGATAQPRLVFGPGILPFTLDWYRYAIYNDTAYTGVNFTVADIEFAQSLDPSGISTHKADISPFMQRGGKLLTYHGTMDELIPLGNSRRYYNNVARELEMSKLDEFYRLFTIPGMQHCAGGPGAWQFGQAQTDIVGLANDSSSNILLALVDWVEGGVAPETIVGTKFEQDTASLGVQSQRAYCPYPAKSVLKQSANSTVQANSWECQTL